MAKDDITIYEIAKEAGVSPATVSRVLTNSARVSPAKKSMVQQVINKYHFQPNAAARSLIDTRTHIIGMMVADIRNPFYASVVVECELAAQRRGYTLVLCNLLDDQQLENRSLENLYAQRVDAIIQIGSRVDDRCSDPDYVNRVRRISQRIPFITTGKLDGVENCWRINLDQRRSLSIALEYLMTLGHRRIAFLGGRWDVSSTWIMRQSFIRFTKAHQLYVCPEYIVDSNYNETGGYEAFEKLWAHMPQPPTACICVNDFVALGVYKALRDHGMRIPQDMSVMGFDNTYLARLAEPGLTSMDYDYPAFGEQLISLSLAAALDQNPPHLQYLIPQMVIRQSTAAASDQLL
ncbi:LacI family transcriptional regulator [Oscillospiraceae bacterium HV4-5-C5C]|nr:LacI family transcriptional regulator [Oscillospiraceae bacterium HV4-5-C5C]